MSSINQLPKVFPSILDNDYFLKKKLKSNHKSPLQEQFPKKTETRNNSAKIINPVVKIINYQGINSDLLPSESRYPGLIFKACSDFTILPDSMNIYNTKVLLIYSSGFIPIFKSAPISPLKNIFVSGSIDPQSGYMGVTLTNYGLKQLNICEGQPIFNVTFVKELIFEPVNYVYSTENEEIENDSFDKLDKARIIENMKFINYCTQKVSLFSQNNSSVLSYKKKLKNESTPIKKKKKCTLSELRKEDEKTLEKSTSEASSFSTNFFKLPTLNEMYNDYLN